MQRALAALRACGAGDVTPPRRFNDGHHEGCQRESTRYLCVPDCPVPREQAFLKAMRGKQYGEEETRDAFAWFSRGWRAALDKVRV